MEQKYEAALHRLLEVAQSDTGQSRRCANFLLAWWNADSCGGFDLTDFWAVDSEQSEAMLVVLQFVARNHWYPDSLGYARDFNRLVRGWRPHLIRDDGIL